MLILVKILAICGGTFLLLVTAMKAFRDLQIDLLIFDSLIIPTAMGVASIIFGWLLPKQLYGSNYRNGGDDMAAGKAIVRSRPSITAMLNLFAAVAGIIGTAIALLNYFGIKGLNLLNLFQP